MIVGIFGFGVVGGATAEELSRLGHSVAVWDTDRRRLDEARTRGYDVLDGVPDVLFLCVPEGALEDALAAAPPSPITVIRSTVPPGTTDRLSEQAERPLVYMPEFLREATALWDALNPAFIIIGCHNQKHGQAVAQLFAPLLAPITLVEPATAEMVKLTLNAYLHAQVSFWNELHILCERIGVQSHVVGKLVSQDPRVPAYGASMHGQPVQGRCLPKDLTQLITFARELGCEPDLLTAVQRVNERIAHAGARTSRPARARADNRRLQVVR